MRVDAERQAILFVEAKEALDWFDCCGVAPPNCERCRELWLLCARAVGGDDDALDQLVAMTQRD